ncbi:23S rRNA pseudouridine1911/1915/1917 synthase [Salibacterium salarium]|uniref:RluA family pseudouridine synthase n=1 Tax=Salibacterium salarium TaxID=284579 RepID=UPI002787F399|nr:RluA family pseudouridine synthase [Salibacterium salarium]MDQ0298842.1 23S rRNA pseudouridine1911/1915/1917 synthase [Salibacterium salarium]
MNAFHVLEWNVPLKDEGKKLKSFLRQTKGMSSSTWKTVKKDGQLIINNESASGYDILEDGDRIAVYLPAVSFPSGIPRTPLPLSILYEDNHLLIVNKPPKLPTLPGRGQEQETLAGAVRHYYERNNINASFHAVSRLDRDTSGIVTLAKHRYAHQRLAAFFYNNQGLKKYTGIVKGEWFPKTGTILAPIEKRPDSIVKQHVVTNGKNARTGFRVEHRGRGLSLVTFTLYTGRTHQIRIHSSYVGHPLVGDDLYGGLSIEIPRQALHAKELNFCHPVTDTWHKIDAPLPEDMRNLWDGG